MPILGFLEEDDYDETMDDRRSSQDDSESDPMDIGDMLDACLSAMHQVNEPWMTTVTNLFEATIKPPYDKWVRGVTAPNDVLPHILSRLNLIREDGQLAGLPAEFEILREIEEQKISIYKDVVPRIRDMTTKVIMSKPASGAIEFMMKVVERVTKVLNGVEIFVQSIVFTGQNVMDMEVVNPAPTYFNCTLLCPPPHPVGPREREGCAVQAGVDDVVVFQDARLPSHVIPH